MKNFLITIIIMAIAGSIGTKFGGEPGWLTGIILGYVVTLLILDIFNNKRSVDGFWLRNRGHIFSMACIFIGLTVGEKQIGGWTGYFMGVGGGWLISKWLGNSWGWSEEAHEANMNIRFAYVTVLANAAKADGILSDKEKREITRVTKDLFSSIGLGSSQDVEGVLNAAMETDHTQQEIIDLIRHFPTEVHNALQFDILRVIFTTAPPSNESQQWLDFIISSGVFTDWSPLQFFMRNLSVSNSRAEALIELELDTNATHEEIKRAYRTKAHEFHPDKLHNVPPQLRALAEAKMAAINNAYQELMGTKKEIGTFFFCSDDSAKSFPISKPSSFVCACWLCSTKNRIPDIANPKSARCGECHALLGMEFDPVR